MFSYKRTLGKPANSKCLQTLISPIFIDFERTFYRHQNSKLNTYYVLNDFVIILQFDNICCDSPNTVWNKQTYVWIYRSSTAYFW